MSTLVSTDINDLVIGTLNNLGRPKFINVATALQSYEVMPRLIKKAKTLSGGIGLRRRPMLSTSGNAKMIGHHEVDTYNITDLLSEFTVPWRRSTTHWAYGTQEVLENSGEALVTNIVQPRELGALIDLAELMETQAFSAPTSSSDKLSIWGFEYWLPSSQTTGFNGQNPSGFSDKAGIDATDADNANFRSYTGAYTDVSKNDLVSLMRGALRKIRWRPPATVVDAVNHSGKYKIYVDDDRADAFEELAEGQNENLGQNIAPSEVKNNPSSGDVMFKRIPICYVPELDSKTDGSVYMIDMDAFYPIVLKGDNMRRTGPEPIPYQHNDMVVHIDLSWNMVCESPRTCARFVLTT